MDFVARKTQEFQEKKNATQNLVPRDQIERMHVLWKKGRNMLASFFTEIDAIRRQINDDALFSDWCFFQLGIGVNGLGEVASALRRDDAERVRNDFADAKKIEKERLAAEAHARRMEAQDRKNALSAKKVENAERKAAEVAEAKKAKTAEIAATRKARRAERAKKEGDGNERAIKVILENPDAKYAEIAAKADVGEGTVRTAILMLQSAGKLPPKAEASSEGAIYDRCVERGRAAVLAEGESRWTEGDLAITVSALKNYGDLKRFANDIGIEYSTLQGRKNVAKAWPQTLPRGSFSVARELVTHPDRHAILARDPHMTVEEACEIMRKYRATTNIIPLREAE